MDPTSAAGLTFGAVSVILDVFDQSVKLFKFFSSMIHMPEECERCRLQLMIEYNRLLAWGDAVGMVSVPDGSHIASSLGTNAMELCGIVSRISWLLLEFKNISQRWESERQRYRPGFLTTTDEEARDKDFTQHISSLSATYECNEGNRERINLTNRLTKWVSNAKQVVTRPHRIRWVMVDRGAFDVLLHDLHGLTERLHELSGDHRQKGIQEITAKTYREMVILRNELTELKAMFDAVAHLLSFSTNAGSTKSIAKHNDSHETLRDLLRLKEIKCVSDGILTTIKGKTDVEMDRVLEDVVTVHRYDGTSFRNHWKAMSMAEKSAAAHRKRPRGTLSQEGTEYEAWVEWRTAENLVHGSPEERESTLRTAALGQMLSKDNPRGLSCPTCIGVIDDREDNDRFGWIFRMPEGSEQGTGLKTLHSVLGQSEKAMAAPDDSFFLDAISPEAYRHENADHETAGESRDEPPIDLPATSADTEPSGARARDMSTLNTPLLKDASPQAMFIFVIGDHRFSDSCELGILDEHPEALKAITSNPCLSTSAFLKPALQAAMAELQPSLMVPAAVRLTAISLRLVAGILPNHQSSHQGEGTDQGEEQGLSKMVQHELEKAVPYYRWQGSKHHCGRVQYLMALLEEAVRVMAVSKNSLIEALRLDAAAEDALQTVVQSIRRLGQDPEEVCGTWAAELLPSMCVSRHNRQRSTSVYSAPSTPVVKGLKAATPPGSEDEDEDELPSPAGFLRRKSGPKAAQAVPQVEPRASKVNDDIVESGNAEDPLYIFDSDSDPGDHHSPGSRTKSSTSAALRHSGRRQARKFVDYSVLRHSQDDYLPAARKRPRMTQGENSTLGPRTASVKRNKT